MRINQGSKFQSYRRLTGIFVCIFLMGMHLMPAKVKVYPGKEDNFSAGKYLKKIGKLDLGSFVESVEISKKNYPKFLNVIGDDSVIALQFGNKVMVIDTVKGNKLAQFDRPDTNMIFKSKGAGFVLCVYGETENRKLARFDTGAASSSWEIPFNLENKFFRGAGKAGQTIHIPIHFAYRPEENTLFFCGITFVGMGSHTKIFNQVLEIKADHGEIISERNFDYRRSIDETFKIFVDKEKKEFKIFNFTNGRIVMKASYTPDIFPKSKSSFYFADFDIIWPVKRALSGGTFGFYDYAWLDFSTVFTDKGLLINTRWLKDRIKPGVEYSRWALIDEKNGNTEIIDPAPNGGLDMAIRNISGEKWPIIVPDQEAKGGAGWFREPKPFRFWLINKDGSMKPFMVTMPVEENKWHIYNHYQNRKWCHDGEYLYYLYSPLQPVFKRKVKDRKLLKVKIGGEKVDTVYTYGNKEFSSYFFFGDNGHVILTGENRKPVVKLPEGKEVPESEYSEKMGADIYQILSINIYRELWLNAIKKEPFDSIPGRVKRSKSNQFLTFDHGLQRVRKNFRYYGRTDPLVLTSVWGYMEGFTGKIDIGLGVTGLNDQSNVLYGYHVPDGRILFYVPVNYIHTKTDGVLAYITYLNKKEAMLTVLTDLSTIHFYKLTRPE